MDTTQSDLSELYKLAKYGCSLCRGAGYYGMRRSEVPLRKGYTFERQTCPCAVRRAERLLRAQAVQQ